MKRSMIAVSAVACTSLGGLLAQSAPVSRAPSPATRPAGSQPATAQGLRMLRFQSVADELRRTGDEALAKEVMRAAEKLARMRAEEATPQPDATAPRPRRARAGGDGVPLLRDMPILDRLFAARDDAAAPAPARSETEDRIRARRPAQPMAAGTDPRLDAPRAPAAPARAPEAVGSGGAQRLEVHHYFHGALPVEVQQMGGAMSGAVSAPRRVRPPQRAQQAPPVPPVPPVPPASPAQPFAPAQPFVAPPLQRAGQGMGGALRAGPLPPTPPAGPLAPRARRAVGGLSGAPSIGQGMGGGFGSNAARSLRAPARGTPAPAAEADGAPGRRGEAASDLERDVDGLQREVDELRALLQKLRAQLRAKKPS